MDYYLTAFVSAMIGGVVAGFFTLRGVSKTFKYQRQQTKDDEEKIIKSLLQAIHDEIETIWERYQNTMGRRVESLKDGEPLNFYYPLFSDFFSIYNGNGALIGRVPDNGLRKQIIKTYTLAKAMVDSFRCNNHLVEKYELSTRSVVESQLDAHRALANTDCDALREYAGSLREGHNHLKREVDKLIKELEKNGIPNQKATDKE